MPSTTIESIVSAYVRLKNRRALNDMRELRLQLPKDLRAVCPASIRVRPWSRFSGTCD
jgi:hypothetical protein